MVVFACAACIRWGDAYLMLSEPHIRRGKRWFCRGCGGAVRAQPYRHGRKSQAD
jgi:hypothetical protein